MRFCLVLRSFCILTLSSAGEVAQENDGSKGGATPPSRARELGLFTSPVEAFPTPSPADPAPLSPVRPTPGPAGGACGISRTDQPTVVVVDCVDVEDGEECGEICDTEDCIDLAPDHECDDGDELCGGGWLSFALPPCNDADYSCEDGDDGDEGDEEGGGEDDTVVKERFVVGQELISTAKASALKHIREEARRRGGYLRDLDIANIQDLILEEILAEDKALRAMLARILYVLATPWNRDKSVEVEVVLHRESLKGAAAEVMGTLIREFPYKRRRFCGRVTRRFRYRIGTRIQGERCLVWNRLLSPLVEGWIREIPEKIESAVEGGAGSYADRITVKAKIVQCGQGNSE